MDGKAAIVTGGASGIGFGVARFLAEMGASVALFDVDKTRGKSNAESIRKNGLFFLLKVIFSTLRSIGHH